MAVWLSGNVLASIYVLGE